MFVLAAGIALTLQFARNELHFAISQAPASDTVILHMDGRRFESSQPLNGAHNARMVMWGNTPLLLIDGKLGWGTGCAGYGTQVWSLEGSRPVELGSILTRWYETNVATGQEIEESAEYAFSSPTHLRAVIRSSDSLSPATQERQLNLDSASVPAAQLVTRLNQELARR